MSDFSKLLQQAKKNYSQQQEKFRKCATSLVDLRNSTAEPKKAASSTPQPRGPSTSNVASSISAIRNNAVQKLANQVAKAEFLKKVEEDEKKRVVAKEARSAKVPCGTSIVKHQEPTRKEPKKAPAPGLDFKKLMEVAKQNAQKGGPNSANQSVSSSFRKEDSSLRNSVQQPSNNAVTKKIPLKKPTGSLGSQSVIKNSEGKRLVPNGNASTSLKANGPISKSAMTNMASQPSKTSKAAHFSKVSTQNQKAKIISKAATSTTAAKSLVQKSSSVKSAGATQTKAVVTQRSQSAIMSKSVQGSKVPTATSSKQGVANGVHTAKNVQQKQVAHVVAKSKPIVKGNVSNIRDRPPRELPLLPFLDRVPTKRKAKPAVSYEEEDSDLEGFIVSDDEVDGGGGSSKEDYRTMLRELTGYDPASYDDFDDDDCGNMVSSFGEITREEHISAKLGLKEDLEDMRLEQEMAKKKMMKKHSSPSSRSAVRPRTFPINFVSLIRPANTNNNSGQAPVAAENPPVQMPGQCQGVVARPLHSLNTDDPVGVVTFVNRTNSASGELFWLNYEGQRVYYGTLHPAHAFSVITYKTHPWLCFDPNSGQFLHINGEYVFYPETLPEDDEDPFDRETVVSVTKPFNSLQELCLGTVKRSFSIEQLAAMFPHVPPKLLDILKARYEPLSFLTLADLGIDT